MRSRSPNNEQRNDGEVAADADGGCGPHGLWLPNLYLFPVRSRSRRGGLHGRRLAVEPVAVAVGRGVIRHEWQAKGGCACAIREAVGRSGMKLKPRDGITEAVTCQRCGVVFGKFKRQTVKYCEACHKEQQHLSYRLNNNFTDDLDEGIWPNDIKLTTQDCAICGDDQVECEYVNGHWTCEVCIDA